MPTRAEAEAERRDAEADIREEGARVTLHYEGVFVDAATGGPTPGSSAKVLRVFALIGGYGLSLIDGSRVQAGDMRLTVADLSLEGLSVRQLSQVGEDESLTGYWALLDRENPEQWPEASENPPATVRRLAIVRLEQTVYTGGYPVLRVFQCRG